MGTHSHFLMTLALKKRRDQNGQQTHGTAFLLGSFMPDMPLTIFTLAYFVYWRWFTDGSEFVFGPTYDAIYFENPWMIAAHNILHSPIPIAVMGGIGYWAAQRERKWGGALMWFAAACAFHSIVDIFTHHNDGPLLLFPFNWQLRFISPVSYWDPNYYGDIFSRFELALDILIVVWLVGLWWYNRRARQKAAAA